MEIAVQWQWSPKQAHALAAPEPFLLYGGAKGGGKSVFLVRWAIQQCASQRGNKGFLGRKRAVDFNNTTLETLRKFVEPQLYRINEQKKKIFLPWCDGVIDYGGLDEPKDIEKFHSAEYGFLGIDQAEEISRDEFAILRGTLRHKLLEDKEPHYQMRLTANPSQGWLKDCFLLAPLTGFRFIQALPSDNPFLASSYIQNLKEAFQHREALLQAYLYGSWDALDSHDVCIQTSWIDKAKTRQPTGLVLKRIVVNDPAQFGDDENVIYVMEQSEIAAVTEQVILEHKSTMDTAGRLAALQKKHQATLIVVDATGIGAGIVDALRELEAPVLALQMSAKPTQTRFETRYLNLRSQLWLEAGRLFADGGCAIPNDPILAGQLASATFRFTSNGRMQVEGKESLTVKVGRSPDRADAYLMGLHGLKVADRLDEAQWREKMSDRQGQGDMVTSSTIDTGQPLTYFAE